jgi:hypothetical protein
MRDAPVYPPVITRTPDLGELETTGLPRPAIVTL